MAAKQARKGPAAAPSTPAPKSRPTGPAYRWEGGFFRRHWIPLLLLFALSAAPYLQSVRYGYVLDDTIVITGNQFTQKGVAGIWDIFSTESMTGYFGEQKDLVAGARYRPLSIVTFAVEKSFADWVGAAQKSGGALGKVFTSIERALGMDTALADSDKPTQGAMSGGPENIRPGKPWIGHLGNILFYAFTCLLLYRVLLLIFPLPADREWWWSVPFVAALLYALHPLHTEVVANIKGRDEIMTFLGALGSIWFTFRWLSDKKPLWLALSGVSFFLGLLSKENAITFLAVIPAILWFFTKARSSDIRNALMPILGASILYLIIRYNVIGYFLSSGKKITDLMNNPFVDMNLGEKLATITYTLGLYLKLLVFPHPLCHDYYPYAIPIMKWTDWKVWLSFLAYAGIVAAFFLGYRKKTLPAFAALFFVATVSIVSNLLFPVGTFMNERFIFISSMAFVLVLAWVLVDKLPEWLPGKAGLPLGLLLAAVLAGGYLWKTWTRVPDWQNALTLNSSAIKVSPNSARANTFMATAMFRQLYLREKDPVKKKQILDQIGVYIRKSIEIYPAYFSGLQMYTGVIAEEFLYDKDVDKLLAGFRKVFVHRDYLQFVDQYLDYLDSQPRYYGSLIPFYLDVGYNIFWQQRRNKAYALKFIDKGLALAPGDQALLKARSEVMQGS